MTILWLGLLVSAAHAGWTPPVRISDEGSSFAPRIAANGDTLHVVYWRGGAFTSSYYVHSDDNGGAWSEPFHLPDTTHTSENVVPIIQLEGSKIAVVWRGDIRGGELISIMVIDYRLMTG